MMDLKELRKKAMENPQSLSEAQWDAINKAAFTVPKKEFFDEDAKVSSSGPSNMQKRKGWW